MGGVSFLAKQQIWLQYNFRKIWLKFYLLLFKYYLFCLCFLFQTWINEFFRNSLLFLFLDLFCQIYQNFVQKSEASKIKARNTEICEKEIDFSERFFFNLKQNIILWKNENAKKRFLLLINFLCKNKVLLYFLINSAKVCGLTTLHHLIFLEFRLESFNL